MVLVPAPLKATTPLADRLRTRISQDGPITFAEWMKAALYDETDGYYCRSDRKRWGRAGDYRTSPERSSLFSATFARYFAELHQRLNSPAVWTIVEAGAGDGRFAEDVLQTLRELHPRVFEATTYVVDEIAETSRAEVERRLNPFAGRVVFRGLDEINVDPGIVFSNELLDAFPIHRVVRRSGELQELYVGLSANDNFEFVPGRLSTPRIAEHLSAFGIDVEEGQTIDVNLQVEDWLRRAANAIQDGYLVTVDYGAEGEQLYDATVRPHGTLRGFDKHAFVDDILQRPGEHDLTTTVNWSVVKKTGEKYGLEVTEFASQDKFLLAAGLLEQLEIESERCNDEVEGLALRASPREMILPGTMASHFQVLVQRKQARAN